MTDYTFQIEKLRFHLIQKDILILEGKVPFNKDKDFNLEIFLDENSVEIETHSTEGSFVIMVSLPSEWEQKSKLLIWISINEKKHLVDTFLIKNLIKRRNQIEVFIELEQIHKNKLIISGWLAGQDETQFEVTGQDGKNLVADVTKYSRTDVLKVFPELCKDQKVGFKLEVAEADALKSKYVLLKMIAGKQYYIHKINLRRLQSGKSNTSISRYGRRLLYSLKHQGIKTTLIKIKDTLHFSKNHTYVHWKKKYDISKEELEEQRKEEFKYNPLISVVVPLYNTPISYLRDMVESIIKQTYTTWELILVDASDRECDLSEELKAYTSKCKNVHYILLDHNKGISDNTNAGIEKAQGEFVAFMDHDDLLTENALFECVKVFNDIKNIDIIYSDEDKIDEKGKTYFEPHFKSDFNLDLLRSMNYICHFFVVKKSIIQEIGGLRSEFDGAQDYDFVLRCIDKTSKIYHIQQVLYHWRSHMDSTAFDPESKSYAFEAGRKALLAHYERNGIPAKVFHGQYKGVYETIYLLDEQPLVSILIPNKDHIDDLEKCICSIIEKSSYTNIEVVIIENNSIDPKTFSYYNTLEQSEWNVKIIYFEGEFNFSKINNFGVAHATGNYLLLLNNDTELINPESIRIMLGYCMREDVGVVGAKLYYPDDIIQHAGVVIGFGGIAGHTFIGQRRDEAGYFSRLVCSQNYSAVTAACLMTKKSVYEEVGGFTEELRVAFNDIDYCLKVRRQNQLVVYTPQAEFYHHESKSRGLEDNPEKIERFNSEIDIFRERWSEILISGDPYYNRNLSLNKADFSLKE